MRDRRPVITVIVVSGLLLLGSHGAHAQGCMTIIMEYLGKPLLKSMVEEGGKLIVQHFAAKLETQTTVGSNPRPVEPTQGDSRRWSEDDADSGLANSQDNPGRGSGRQFVLTDRDVAELQQEYADNGKSVCELRRDIQAMFGGDEFAMPPPAPAAMCVTPAGACTMFTPVPVDTPCTCTGFYGSVLGIAR